MSRNIKVRRQTGAALIVGLLLLLVVTLLAVSGMNSASLELVMAGNTQYHQNAFRAAEEGTHRALEITGQEDIFNPSVPKFPADEPEEDEIPGFGHFSYQVVAALGGAPQPAMWKHSMDAFSSFHFDVPSVGTSLREARVEHAQGVAILGPKDHTQMALLDGGEDEEDNTILIYEGEESETP